MAETIVLKVKGLADYKNDLDEIVAAAREALPDADVEVEDPQRMQKGRYGVVFGEILSVSLSFGGGYVFGKVADAITKTAVEGWKKHQAGNAVPRPRFINFYGPDDEVLKEVKVNKETIADEDALLVGDREGQKSTEDDNK
jgi:hypothetical protein